MDRRAFLRTAGLGSVALALPALGMPAAALAKGRDDGGHDDDDATILEFKRMAPVTGPFVGAANPIRGVPGGGLPWIISEGRGELSADGHLEVRVRGLVLARMAPVPANLQGVNPVPNFRAIVSCLSIDAMGNPTTVNVTTDPFPASTTGDAEIEAWVSLPHPCIAPIVFVTSPTGAWFAATGA
ncbi:MAG TPA: hypothetical protein VFW96_07275 [Thermomicrobiales bacterium]|nr:hypothetical protein [Thermomicrobiales bacterium]